MPDELEPKRGRDGRRMNPASLANLRPGAGAWQPGVTGPNLRHGLRSREPARIVIDPLVREIEAALAADLPLKDADGGTPGADRFAVELAAIALLRVRRVSAYLELHGDSDDRGNLRAELDGLGRAVEHAAKMLDRIGCSPRARAALGLSLVRTVDQWEDVLADGARRVAEREARDRAGDVLEAGETPAERVEEGDER